jgi:hypothetical protein
VTRNQIVGTNARVVRNLVLSLEVRILWAGYFAKS